MVDWMLGRKAQWTASRTPDLAECRRSEQKGKTHLRVIHNPDNPAERITLNQREHRAMTDVDSLWNRRPASARDPPGVPSPAHRIRPV